MKLLIAGGGTGGHVFPALAVAREWLRRGAEREVVIVGTERGMETRLVPRAGLPLETVRAAGLSGVGALRKLRAAAMIPATFAASFGLLRRHRPAAALGVGGYASGTVMLAAAAAGIPTVIFEPNATPGLANRLLGPVAARVATGFAETAAGWGPRARWTGCPVRPEFFSIAPRPHTPPMTLLVTGGSQGALAINRAVVDALDALAARKDSLRVIHQTGERDYNAVRVAYARREFIAEVVPFIEDMAAAFSRADLIVCRSGAVTAAEVAAAGRAAIFLPFAGAAGHQRANARAFERAGAGRLVPPDELTGERLAREIFALLDQPRQIEEMERRARALARPRAAEELVNLVEEVAGR